MEDIFRKKVIMSLEHLNQKHAYSQQTLIHKLSALGFEITPSQITKIKKGNPVGRKTLFDCARFMEELMAMELDMKFDDRIQDFVLLDTPGWRHRQIPEEESRSFKAPELTLHASGRFSVEEKSLFISGAQEELVELGVRLNSYTSYFISHSDSAFKNRIIELLKSGVNMRGYLLDPESQEARIYFNDRTRAQKFEKDALEESKRNIDRLKTICQEFNGMSFKGTFDIFLYRHIPYTQLIVVDSQAERAKMMVSPYLYGLKRANCPVFVFSKKNQSLLFRKYWESFQLYTSNAEKIS